MKCFTQPDCLGYFHRFRVIEAILLNEGCHSLVKKIVFLHQPFVFNVSVKLSNITGAITSKGYIDLGHFLQNLRF